MARASGHGKWGGKAKMIRMFSHYNTLSTSVSIPNLRTLTSISFVVSTNIDKVFFLNNEFQ